MSNETMKLAWPLFAAAGFNPDEFDDALDNTGFDCSFNIRSGSDGCLSWTFAEVKFLWKAQKTA